MTVSAPASSGICPDKNFNSTKERGNIKHSYANASYQQKTMSETKLRTTIKKENKTIERVKLIKRCQTRKIKSDNAAAEKVLLSKFLKVNQLKDQLKAEIILVQSQLNQLRHASCS